MSRIGRLPIKLPAGVIVTVDGENLVTVKGPKGTLSQKVNKDITIAGRTTASCLATWALRMRVSISPIGSFMIMV